MDTPEIPAMRFSQDGITLFVTAMTSRDINNSAEIDQWDPALDDDDLNQGYQRDVVTAHAKRIAKFLLNANGHHRLMPTAILLSARSHLEFRPMSTDGGEAPFGFLKLNSPLYKVDGQHRSEGFKLAAESDPNLLGFRLPVVIMEGIEKLEEVRQFYNVNATAKRVRTDLADRLLRALGELESAVTGWRKKALQVVDVIGRSAKSPWFDRIKLPNDRRGAAGPGIASQRTFTQSLKPVFDGVLKNVDDADQVATVIDNFWSALRNLMPEAFENPDDYVIQKSVGVFSLHIVAAHVFLICFQEGNDFSVDKMEKVLEGAGEYVEAGFWLNTKHGGKAPTYQGMGGFAALAKEMVDELGEGQVVINI